MKLKFLKLLILFLIFSINVFSAPVPKATMGSWQVRGMIRTNSIANYYHLPTNTNVNALDIYCVTGVSNGQSAGFYQNNNSSWHLIMPISFTNSNLSGNYLGNNLTNTRIMMTSYSNKANIEFMQNSN